MREGVGGNGLLLTARLLPGNHARGPAAFLKEFDFDRMLAGRQLDLVALFGHVVGGDRLDDLRAIDRQPHAIIGGREEGVLAVSMRIEPVQLT